MMLSRRAVLRSGFGAACALLGLGLGACGRAASVSPCPVASSGEIVLGADPASFFLYIPSLAANFHRFDSHVEVVPYPDAVSLPLGRTHGRAPFVLTGIIGHSPPLLYASLNEYLRSLNFPGGHLMSSAMGAFEARGQVYGLPAVAHPLVVGWRRDVFRAAGLPAPREDWTLDDLVTACEGIRGVVRSGRVPGLRSIMPPMVAAPEAGSASGPAVPGWLQTHPSIWPGFALGFGGTIYSGDAFTLLNAGTVTGLQALVDLVRLDGVPAAPLRAGDVDPVNVMNSAAIQFVSYPDAPIVDDPRWAFARFPAMPNPVIPTEYEGTSLDFQHGGGSAQFDAQAGAAIAAATAFMVWLAGNQPRGILEAAGFPPVAADPDVQNRFWATAPGRPLAADDWMRFVDYMQGWPLMVNGAFTATDIVYRALEAAVSDPSALRNALREAEGRLAAELGDKHGLVPAAVNAGGPVSVPITSFMASGPNGCT